MQNSYSKGCVQDFQKKLKQIGIRWHICMDEQVIAPLCFWVTSLPALGSIYQLVLCTRFMGLFSFCMPEQCRCKLTPIQKQIGSAKQCSVC